MTLRFLTGGESHGPAMLAILEGMVAGLSISQNIINKELLRRQKGLGSGPRMKLEKDEVTILSGVLEGVTTGGPISMMINNADHLKWKGRAIPSFTIPRPGHADLVGAIKYQYCDLRPSLERASARETSSRVAVGAVCKHFLEEFGIVVGGYIVSIGGIDADLSNIDFLNCIRLAEESDVRCPDKKAEELIKAKIQDVIKNKDTLGGIIEIVVTGLPAGLGSFVHWDRRLETKLSAVIMGVQAIKGVEIGPAFENTRLFGTQVQDGIRLGDSGQNLIRNTNRSGGLEGGVTTGEPIVIRAAMKPIATTLTPQLSVDLFTKKEVQTEYERSDFCPVPRAVPILEAVVAYVIADALLEKLGGDSMDELKNRFEALPKANLDDIQIDGFDHVFWSETP